MFEPIEEQIRKMNEEFARLKSSFDEFFEARRREMEESVRAMSPAIEEAKRRAEVRVEQTPEGKVKATIHGEVEIEDEELKRRILKAITEKKESEGE